MNKNRQVFHILSRDLNNNIGDGKRLVHHEPEDLMFFSDVTRGHIVIMGNNTFNSINRKPLVDRVNIVVTREHLEEDRPDEGLFFRSSVHEAVCLAQEVNIKGEEFSVDFHPKVKIYSQNGKTKSKLRKDCYIKSESFIFVIGGLQIYESSHRYIDGVICTLIPKADYSPDLVKYPFVKMISKDKLNTEFLVNQKLGRKRKGFQMNVSLAVFSGKTDSKSRFDNIANKVTRLCKASHLQFSS